MASWAGERIDSSIAASHTRRERSLNLERQTGSSGQPRENIVRLSFEYLPQHRIPPAKWKAPRLKGHAHAIPGFCRVDLATEDAFERAVVVWLVLETDLRCREAAVGLTAEVQDHEGGYVLHAERRRRGDLDANRIHIFIFMRADDDGVADKPEVLRELPHARTHCVRREYQVIKQRIRAHRRQAGELQRQVRGEAHLLGA
jgi:hypothetical protein